MHACTWRPGRLDVARFEGGREPGQTLQTLAPCACSRSRSRPPEPTCRPCLTIRRPMRGSSLAALLGQRLAGLVEHPPLLAPRACRDFHVHRVDGRSVLRVTCLGSTVRSCCSMCSSCRLLAMDEGFQPLRAAPLPRVRRARHALLHRHRSRGRCRLRRKGDWPQSSSMTRRRGGVECDLHSVQLDRAHATPVLSQPASSADILPSPPVKPPAVAR